jgi:extracellular elastinolytic metalloproteinase
VSAARAARETLPDRAVALVRGEGADYPEGDEPGWVPIGQPQTTDAGVSIVMLQQHHRGVPVRQAVRSVQVGADGAGARLRGRTIDVPAGLGILPDVGVIAAVHAAARHLGAAVSDPPLDVSHRRPRLFAQHPQPTLPSVLSKRPFEDPVTASLVVTGEGAEARLAWEVRLELPGGVGAYELLVEATGRRTRHPQVLAMRSLTAHATAVLCDVFVYDPDSPPISSPLPRPRDRYPALGGAPLPPGRWVDGDSTGGNNAIAVSSRGKRVKADLDAEGRLVFPSQTPPGLEQAAVNAFYWCNVVHDLFHLLGFDEAARNFQATNVSGLGSGDDAVEITIWNKGIDGLANFLNHLDGREPKLNLGLLHRRHSALDADIVIHEYVHGVVNRTVGNGQMEEPLEKPQSRSLAEGICDYYAITIQNHLRRLDGADEDWVFGRWIADRPAGLRPSAYRPVFTGTYGSLRTPGFENDHDAGQVWCATLLDVNDVLAGPGDPASGEELGWRLVFNALKRLHPDGAGPTWLDARDAILDELEGVLGTGPEDHPRGRKVLAAFHARGMGPLARSADAGYGGIEEDVG